VDDERLDAERQSALDMALRWCVGVQLQLDRLAKAEQAVEATVWDRPLLGTEEGQRRFLRLRVDEHLLVVAARNLVRALDDGRKIGIPTHITAAMPANLSAHIKTVRDCSEHWDQRATADTGKGIKGQAYRDFARDYPDEDAGSYHFGGGETKVWGIDLRALGDVTRRIDALVKEEAAKPALDWDFR
jgi:hypothetical protein